MFPLQVTTRTTGLQIGTWLLIAINVVVFLFEATLPPPILEQFLRLFGLVPARVTSSLSMIESGPPIDLWWPFITSMFLHGGWMHLFSNMWTLYLFGEAVEDRMGTARYLIFYLLCGLVAGLTHYFSNPMSSVPTVGASGAIAGVLGAYYLFFPRAHVVILVPIFFWPFFFELPAVTYLFFWFFMQLLNGTMSLAMPQDVGGIAWMAHAGGFAAGALLCYLFAKPRRQQPQWDPDEFGYIQAWKHHL
ncbi:MAG: rhomboid family intramembrane serine protease [Pirellulaceae bacterium]|nr:MAG: rhomboid family intramembrane serine protease [Pirellulaceae bacterium]